MKKGDIKYGKLAMIGVTKYRAAIWKGRQPPPEEGSVRRKQGGEIGKDDSHLRRRDQLIDPKQDYCQQRSCTATNLE